MVDIKDKMSMTHAIMRLDKANQFFEQPSRLENKKETAIDFEAIEQYYQSSDAIIDLEEKYFNSDNEEESDEQKSSEQN